VVAEFHPETAGGLDAGVRQHADEDDLLDSMLFELLVEVSISKAALRPVLLDDDVFLLRDKVRMPVTAPSTLSRRSGSQPRRAAWESRVSNGCSRPVPSDDGER